LKTYGDKGSDALYDTIKTIEIAEALQLHNNRIAVPRVREQIHF